MFRLLRGIGISWKLRSVDVQADVGNFLVGLGFLQQKLHLHQWPRMQDWNDW